MVNTKTILALVVSVAVASGVIFAIDNFVLNKEFDLQKTVMDIVLVSGALFVGSMVAKKVSGKSGLKAEVSK
jgi:hypothetical protein